MAVSPFLELSGYLEASRVWFPSRAQEYSATSSRARVRVSPSTRLAIHALLQHNSAFDVTAANVRCRYTISDGNDVFLVFTSGSAGLVGGATAGEARGTTRRLMVKYSATIR